MKTKLLIAVLLLAGTAQAQSKLPMRDSARDFLLKYREGSRAPTETTIHDVHPDMFPAKQEPQVVVPYPVVPYNAPPLPYYEFPYNNYDQYGNFKFKVATEPLPLTVPKKKIGW